MKITDHVKGRSTFQHYRAGYLYYKTDTGFEFTIPISDTNEATFPAEEKSLLLMRWIRKAIDALPKNECVCGGGECQCPN